MSKSFKKNAHLPFAKPKADKKNKSLRAQTNSYEKVAPPGGLYYPLPFGPVRFQAKMELVKQILTGSGDHDDLSAWRALGLLGGDAPDQDSTGASRDSLERPRGEFGAQRRLLEALPRAARRQTLRFMRKVFGQRGSRLTVLDVVFKDLFASDLSNKEAFQSYLDHHWSTVLGKISLENLSIKANGKSVG